MLHKEVGGSGDASLDTVTLGGLEMSSVECCSFKRRCGYQFVPNQTCTAGGFISKPNPGSGWDFSPPAQLTHLLANAFVETRGTER